MKLLRLATTLNSTSAPYNQFYLGFETKIDQTYCSLLNNEILIKDEIKIYHGNGSIYRMIRLVRDLVSKNDYSVVHIHSGVTGIIFLISIFPFKLNLLKKTVFTLHNCWNVINTKNQILNLIVMLVSKRICACSESSKKSIPWLINIFIGKKTSHVVNGFNHHRIDVVEKEHNYKNHFKKDSKIKILCIGALNNTKNQIKLLKILKILKLEAEFIFLGDGANKRKLKNYSKNFISHINIIFKGKVSRNIAIEHMLEADVSISLSKGEGMPIAVLESMYAGCFQILSNIAPHKEILPPIERCIFVDANNKADIINSLYFVRDNISLIKTKRSISREYSLNKFGLDNMLKKYMDVYSSFLTNKNGINI